MNKTEITNMRAAGNRCSRGERSSQANVWIPQKTQGYVVTTREGMMA